VPEASLVLGTAGHRIDPAVGWNLLSPAILGRSAFPH